MANANRFKPIKAPANLSWRRLFLWWGERIEADSGARYTVDLSLLEDDQAEALNQVILACGHGTNFSPSRELLEPAARRFLLVETIFADTETNDDALSKLLTMYRETLESIANQHFIVNSTALHVTYCSVDKLQEFLSLSRLINALNRRTSFFTFLLVPYIHPREGYPQADTGHIDAIRLPNKFYSDNAKKLTAKTLCRLRMESNLEFATSIRAAIDDDDRWLPWAASEIFQIADVAAEQGGRATKAIGVANQLVYYPTGAGRVDLAEWDLVMTGSKFFSAKDFKKLEELTPWMLPEAFTEVQARAFRRLGVDLRVIRGSKAFFLYVRSYGNRSGMLKTDHYLGGAMSREGVGTFVDTQNAAMTLVQNAQADCATNAYTFSVDPPSLTVRGEYDDATGQLRIDGNFTEYLNRRGISNSAEITVVVNVGTDKGRTELIRPLETPLLYDAENWTSRALLRLEHSTGDNIGSAWIRGNAPFLS